MWNSAPQARFFLIFAYFIGGDDSDLARRRRENFEFFSPLYAFSKGILERRRRKFRISVQTRLSPPYDSAEISREGGTDRVKYPDQDRIMSWCFQTGGTETDVCAPVTP